MTTRESGKVCMAKLARIAHRQAELDAERAQLSAEQAKIYNELADGETVDMTTGKRLAREKQLVFDPVDSAERARALQTLHHYQNRKKLRA
jgi:hypothetical protein